MSRMGYRDSVKERRWRKLLGQWQRGDLTVRDFCEDHGLNEHAFYWWRRVIAERDREQASADTSGAEALFVPLHVTPEARADGTALLEVVLLNGRLVRVPAGFDATTLRQVLDVLEARAC